MSDEQRPSKAHIRRRHAATVETIGEERARIIVLAGGPVGQKHLVEGPVIIGRSSRSDIQLGDSEISRAHACITPAVGGRFEIEDLGSRNGVFLNDVAVERAALSYGDRIQLGSRVLLLFTKYDTIHEQLLHRQRLEALGRLAVGIAHDFNNMLGAVRASLDYLRGFPDLPVGDPAIAECLDDARLATDRAAELTPRLLEFGRPEQSHGLVDLSEICAEVGQLAERTFGGPITIGSDIAPGLTVLGSSVQLHQILMNLCLNARDAMPEGGRLELVARRVPVGQTGRGKPAVRVTVRDSGMGMAPQTRQHIFEPFFTTKRAGAGFGLGLASVAEMVAAHGGEIDVDSSRGQGSAFHVTLPMSLPVVGRKPLFATVPPSSPRVDRHRAGLILIVDDEQIVRRSLRRVLTASGYRVIEAGDGKAAIEMLRGGSPAPDLVLLDLDLPELSGEQTQRMLRKIYPQLRVLGISGHIDPAREQALVADGAMGCLHKPWDKAEMLTTLKSALAQRHRRQAATDDTTEVIVRDSPTIRSDNE